MQDNNRLEKSKKATGFLRAYCPAEETSFLADFEASFSAEGELQSLVVNGKKIAVKE